MRPLKKLLNRLVGQGPVRVAPFAGVLAARTDRARGVHQPEGFNGVLKREPGDACAYTPGHSLLGQPDESEMIEGRRRYLPGGIAPPQEKILFSLSDAAVVGTDGIVYCPRTRLAVAEALRTWTTAPDEHPALAAPGLPAPVALPGCTLNLALLSAEGFYHFLIEGLPRLEFAREHLAQVQHVLVNGRPGGFQERWLRQCGVAADAIVWMHGLAHHRCEQLLFTNYLMADYQPTPWIVNTLRRAVRAATPETPGKRRLWISRADARARQLTWEDALLAQLEGFEKITLSELAPAQQLELFAGAGVVAGPHGAGFAHLAFCAPGTRVIEIFPDAHRQPIYARLANVGRLHYAWAVADFAAAQPPAGLGAAMNAFLSEPTSTA